MSDSHPGDLTPWPLPPSDPTPQSAPASEPPAWLAPVGGAAPSALSAPELEIFRQKVARGERNFARWSLARADLQRMDLRDVNFYDADLSGANLYGADLSRANLGNANLTGANLRGANLSGAFMDGARLNGADMIDAVTDRPSHQMPASTTPQAPGTTSVARFCIFCGAQMPPEAIFCAACGKSQPQFTVPLPASASRPLAYAPYAAAPVTYAPAQPSRPLTPLSVSKRSDRTSPAGMITAAIASGLAVFAFFFLPFNPAVPLAGPQMASLTAQNASLVCAAAPNYSYLQPLCDYFNVGAFLMWTLVILAGISLIAAIIGWINSDDSPKGAARTVIACGVISLIIFGYAYIAGQSAISTALQAVQAAGTPAFGFVGLAAGSGLMLVGAVVAIIGGFIQLRAE